MNVVNMDNANIYGCFPVETRQGTSLLHRLFVLALFFAFPLLLHAQDQVTLQFTGKNQNGDYVQLSGVVVENLSQHWQEVLYYPDTILNIGVSGIEETGLGNKGVRLFQNVPNPFVGVTDFALQLPEASNVQLEIYDLNGRMETSYKGTLDQGTHLFRAWLATPQTYLLNARTENGVVQIMMVNAGHAGQSRIEYTGKGGSLRVDNLHNGSKGNSTMPFNYGDTLSYQGTAHLADHAFTSASVVKAQYGSDLIPLVFTLPLPTVTTEAATAISSTQGQLNGYVVEHPDYPVTERGFLFADNTQFNGAVEYSTGAGSGQFHYTVSNLQLATRYYYQAYAQSAMGITYGDVLYFDTQAEMPTVLTLDVMDVKASKATVTGNVTATGGAYVTHRGVCWSTAQNPTLNDSHTDDGNGLGIFTSHITGLTPDTTYYVRAYATNSVGTTYGEQQSFTTGSPFYCGIDTLTDYDGNVYHTVEIGQQCWMKENLRTTHYTDGTDISIGTLTSNSIAYRYYPNNNSTNVPDYGYLYNWAATMHGESGSNANPSGVQGICPDGWHMPSKAEFEQLMNFVSSQSQYVCGNNNIARALAASFGWLCYSNDEFSCFPACYTWLNNATGFSAIPAGQWSGSPADFGRVCTFWSSTSNVIDGSLCAFPFGVGGGVGINASHLTAYAHPVRCLLDDSGVTGDNALLPNVMTKAVSDVAASSASCGGQIYGSGGAAITARGICWDTLPNPTVNNSHTTDGIGTGGFTSSTAGLTPNITYYVRAYATNSVGTAYGEQQSFTTRSAFYCGTDTLTDYDGNVYHTVEIGQQCWMRENLRTTHYSDGTDILPGGTTFSTTVAYRYAPNDNSSNVPLYGYLYNRAAVMRGAPTSNANPSGVQGICPDGWHVPSGAEWMQFIHYVRSQSQYWCNGDSSFIVQALASPTGYIYQSGIPFDSPYTIKGGNPNEYNATGFSVLLAGNALADNFGISALFHSTDPTKAFCMTKDAFSPSLQGFNAPISVRCLLDDSGLGWSVVAEPVVTTKMVGDITSCSAQCGGFVSGRGGADVISRGVCWSTVPNPTVNDSHTADGTGNGGFKSVLSGLTPGTTYHIRAYATNSAGTAYGEELSFTTTHPVADSVLIDAQTCPGADTMMDIDGNVYKTVQIGLQCWMKENLRTTRYADGTVIPIGYIRYHDVAHRYSPFGMESLASRYGWLYNWPAVMHGDSTSNTNPSGVQGICPNGWHVPSKEEWQQLRQYLRSDSRYWCEGDSMNISKALASSDFFWNNNNDFWTNPCAVTNNPTANNASGFSAIPAECFDCNTAWSTHTCAHYWTATLESLPYAYFERVDVWNANAFLIHFCELKSLGFSVRCLRD